MTRLVIFLLLLSPYLLFAQEAQGKVLNDPPKLVASLIFSPGMGYRILKNPTKNVFIDRSNSARNDAESPVQNIGIGFTAGLALSHSFQLGVGARYNTKGYQQDVVPFSFDTLDPVVPNRINIVDRARFIEIPVYATYILYRPKQQFTFSGELYWNRLLDEANISYHHFDDRIEKHKDVRSPEKTIGFLGFGVQAGVQHMFTEKIGLRIAPAFRMDVRDLTDLNLILFHWNVSIDAALQFSL